MDVLDSSLDFTTKAWDKVFDAVDDKSFAEREADLIFNTLRNETRDISFGDFLKRYIYKKAELRGHFEEIPLKTYQEIIAASFADTMTPKAFGPTTAKLGALIKKGVGIIPFSMYSGIEKSLFALANRDFSIIFSF